MKEFWVTRTMTGLAPADADAAKEIERHNIGTTFPIQMPTRVTRSGAWHRRYWVLMTMLADNLDQVEVEPGLVLPIRSKEDAHVAMRYATGLFDSFIVKGAAVRIVKSTKFDSMTPDEWAMYWRKVLVAVHDKFLPGVALPTVENEIARIAS